MYYPLIIKPSNGIEYGKCKFPGQPKVYKAKTPDKAVEFIDKVKAAGYKDTLIVQTEVIACLDMEHQWRRALMTIDHNDGVMVALPLVAPLHTG